MRNTILLILLSLTFGKTFASVYDESQLYSGNWYQVEVLIFRYDKSFDTTEEKWSQHIERFFPADISTLIKSDTISPRAAFTIVAPADHTFDGYIKRLKRSDNIKPLFHAAWRQPKMDRSVSTPLLIQAGEMTEDGQYELEGFIKISIKRYIHIETDLWLSQYEKAPQNSIDDLWFFSADTRPYLLDNQTHHLDEKLPSETKISLDSPFPIVNEAAKFHTKRVARMQQTRRMNRDELHYLDHPLFGILVKTVRYELRDERELIDFNTDTRASNVNLESGAN